MPARVGATRKVNAVKLRHFIDTLCPAAGSVASVRADGAGLMPRAWQTSLPGEEGA